MRRRTCPDCHADVPKVGRFCDDCKAERRRLAHVHAGDGIKKDTSGQNDPHREARINEYARRWALLGIIFW